MMRPSTRRRLPLLPTLDAGLSVSAMLFPLLLRAGELGSRPARIAAAKRAHKTDRRIELARAQVGGEAALQGDLRLGLDDGQIVREPCAIALQGKLVGFLRSGEPGARLRRLLLYLPEGGELVGHFAQRVDKRLVVLLDRRVVVGVALAEVAAQAPAVEDRQPQRR